MRTWALLLFMVLAGLSNASAQTAVDRTIWVAPGGYVRLFNMVGSVKVFGWDKDSLQIKGTVREPPNGEFVVSPGKQGAKVSVWGPSEIGAKPTDLEIRVPRRSQLWIKTQSASITVADFEGGLDAVSITGAISISGRPREVYAESMGGDVNLSVTTRSARVKTGNGKITLRPASYVDDLTLSTVSGPVLIMQSRIAQGHFESVEGSLSYSGMFTSPSALEFITHSGDIELAVPANTGGYVSIDTFEGTFEDDFGVPAKASPGKMKQKMYSFRLGYDSGAEITIRTFKGRVLLRKTPAVKGTP